MAKRIGRSGEIKHEYIELKTLKKDQQSSKERPAVGDRFLNENSAPSVSPPPSALKEPTANIKEHDEEKEDFFDAEGHWHLSGEQEKIRENLKPLLEKRAKEIDARTIESWSADLEKLAQTVPDIKTAMKDSSFKMQYQTLKANIGQGRKYSSLDDALTRGNFDKVKELLERPVYTDYIRESTVAGTLGRAFLGDKVGKSAGLIGRGKLKGAPAPVSPDVSNEDLAGSWVKDTKNVTGQKFTKKAALDETAKAIDLGLLKSDQKTQQLLDKTEKTVKEAENLAAQLNKEEIKELRAGPLTERDADLREALGGDDKIVRELQFLSGQRIYLGEQVTLLQKQDQAIDEHIENLATQFKVLNDERNAQMNGILGEPKDYLQHLSGQISDALKADKRPARLGKDLESLLKSGVNSEVVARVAQFHGGFSGSESLISDNFNIAKKQEEALRQYVADLDILLGESTISPDVRNKLEQEKVASALALESLKKFNDLSFIFQKEDNIRLHLQSLEGQKGKITESVRKLQKASNLVERMDSVVRIRGFTEKTRALNAERKQLNAELAELERIGADDSKVNKGNGFNISSNSSDRQSRMASIDTELQKNKILIDKINGLFNHELAQIKILDADPKKTLPIDTWGQWLWDGIVKRTGIPGGERTGREDVADLVREKLMADQGITLSQSYQALAVKLSSGSTLDGIKDLVASLQGLPAWMYRNPQIAKELVGDITHAISILKQSPEAGQFQGALDNILSRLKAEGLASDLLVGNRSEYEDRDVPPELFALMHMAKLSPYAAAGARGVSAGTIAGNTVRTTVAGILGQGVVSNLLGSLCDIAQRVAQTSVEKNIARSLPVGTDAFVTAAQQLYRGDSYQDVVTRYAAREAAKEMAGHAREIYEDGFGAWFKNIISLRQLRDTWKNSGVGEKIYRVVTEGVLPVGGALAVGFLLGGPVGLALALVISLGGTFLAGRFNDRITPFVTSTQKKIREQRIAERARKFILSKKQYQEYLDAVAGNTGMKKEDLAKRVLAYLSAKVASLAKTSSKDAVIDSINADSQKDTDERVAEYRKQQKEQPLRDNEEKEMKAVLQEMNEVLLTPRIDEAGQTLQPQWNAKTKNALSPSIIATTSL